MKVDEMKLGLTGGILWGLLLFVVTLISVWTGYAAAFLKVVASIYPGFRVSIAGSFIGLVYGFVDMFVGCYIFAWLYNKLEEKKK